MEISKMSVKESNPISCFEAEKVMEKALDIGEAMLCSGAEILRVEDTIMRICLAYGDGIVDVFTILSLIILSWHTTDDKNYTQTRRIYSYSTNLKKLEELNALSRYICEEKPSCDFIEEQVERIMYEKDTKKTSSTALLFGNVLGAAGFAVFFGGMLRDGIAAGIAAVFLYLWMNFYQKHSSNRVMFTLLTSFVAGLICILMVRLGIGVNQDKVMIGIIMLLIPGINMMNSLRDMICGDIITGMLKLAESLMVAVAIAGGFALAIILAGFLAIPFVG